MTRHELEAMFARVLEWPEDLQEQVAIYLAAIEEGRKEFYELTEEEWKAVQEGLAEAERGDFASDEEVEALFNKYRRR